MARKENKSVVTKAFADRMREMANDAGNREQSSSSSWISTKGGNFSIGEEDLGSVLQVCVLDFAFDNAYYEGAYDPSTPATPDCFAIAKNVDDMTPHEDASDPQEQNCEACWANQWESAETGRGKACKNSRRLALITADGGLEEDSDIAFLRLPPASLKAWGSYVNKLVKTAGLPPAAVVTELEIISNKDGGYTIEPSMVTEITTPENQEIVLKAIDSLGDELLAGYPKHDDAEDEKPRKKKATKGKAPRGKSKAGVKGKAAQKKEPKKKAASKGKSKRKF